MVKIEREVKLAAWGGFSLPDLFGVVESVTSRPLAERRLDAVYYDTRDLRLARAGVSLRHRTGDEPPWTVKLPEGDRGPIMNRREIPFDGPLGEIPPQAAALVRAYTRTATLGPVARLKTRRTGVELVVDDQKVAEVVDDEVSVYHGRRLASRFREVEVEIEPEAPPGLLAAVIGRLRAAGAGDADGTAKVARALGPRAQGPPDHAPIVLGAHAAIGEVIRAALTAGLNRMVAHDPGVRLGDDPEDVHQARVGTRRIRSDLRTFRPLLDPEWLAGLREEAGWFAGLLGAVRDAEVLMERLEGQAATLAKEDAAGVASLVRRLADDREAARAHLLEAMNSPRYGELLDRLVAAAAAPVAATDADLGQSAEAALPVLVGRPWRRLRKAVRALPETPADEELHAVRILAKHTRYAAEAAAPVMGKRASAFAQAVAGVQTVLGDHQDACVTEDWLRGAVGAVVAPDEAMLVGQLIGLQRAEAQDRRAAWPKAWKRAADPKLRDWLG
ncbi:MAG TPA: CYTH and CHAD domain-containing protein [Acidimicrobiia bacterium]